MSYICSIVTQKKFDCHSQKKMKDDFIFFSVTSLIVTRKWNQGLRFKCTSTRDATPLKILDSSFN